MKRKLLCFFVLLTGSVCGYAQQPTGVSDLLTGEPPAASGIQLAAADQNPDETGSGESCRCWCTAQGILLHQCNGEAENLGNYGNLANCREHLASHPRCN